MSESKNRENFYELLKRWILIEDNTIDAATKHIDQTKNPFVKILFEIIRRDSEKHKHILETLRLSRDSTVVFTPDDMMLVDSFIEAHAVSETAAIETAEQALDAATLPIPKLLLTHLLDDEKSHDVYIKEMNNLKIYMSKQTD